MIGARQQYHFIYIRIFNFKHNILYIMFTIYLAVCHIKHIALEQLCLMLHGAVIRTQIIHHETHSLYHP